MQMNWWDPVSAFAAVAAAVFSAIAAFAAVRGVIMQSRANRKNLDLKRGRLKYTLRAAKWILENQPSVGFDHVPKPDLGLDQIADALATTDLLPPEATRTVRTALDVLLEVDRLIAETQNEALAPTVKFRQRFPPIRERALSALGDALRAIGNDS